MQVICADNGEEALSVLDSEQVDAIILDLMLPGKDGLVHISQICEERVEKVSDKLSEGDKVKVQVLEVDKQGRIRLSMKGVDQG